MQGQFETVTDARNFLFAGRAIVTLVSTRTGARYTYRVSRARDDESATPTLFVSLLAGPDNGGDYVYVGTIFANRKRLVLTRKSRCTNDSAPVKAFRYLLGGLVAGSFGLMEVYHEGRCGRCGRRLTVPESIATGLGPTCAGLS